MHRTRHVRPQMFCQSRPHPATSFLSWASGPGASYLRLREQATRSLKSVIYMKHTSQASHSWERHCIQSPSVGRIFDTCVVVAAYLKRSCYTFRRQKPFRSDSNALQPRSEPPLSGRELVRVQEETLGGTLCINIFLSGAKSLASRCIGSTNVPGLMSAFLRYV